MTHPTIGSLIRVKDDIELLLQNIDYHRSIGVDCFVICAAGSSDESFERFEELARESRSIHTFRLEISGARPIDSDTMRRRRLTGFQRVVDVFDPDWIIVPDTDEFLVPRKGDLKSVARSATADLLVIDRFNAAITRGNDSFLAQRPSLSELLRQEIVVERTRLTSEHMDEDPDCRWIRHEIGPKFMTRIKSVLEIQPGFHGILSSEPFTRDRAEDLLILHAPFTTLERFERKVHDMKAHLELVGHALEKGVSWTWKQWVRRITDDASLRAEFDRQFFEREEMETLKEQGSVQETAAFLSSRRGL